MQWGMGVLGWSPKQFWRATPIELGQAIRGWKFSNGVEGKQQTTETGKPILSRAEVEDLQELMREHG